MTHRLSQPSNEGPLGQFPQINQQKSTKTPVTFNFDVLESAAKNAMWISSQHQADAFINLASDWLRSGKVLLSENPAHRQVFTRLAAYNATWQGALTRVITGVVSSADRDALQQLASDLMFAVKVGQSAVTRETEKQRTEQLVRLFQPGSAAPFSYFKRKGQFDPLIQCSSSEMGAIPLYIAPHVVLDPVPEANGLVHRIKNYVSGIWGDLSQIPNHLADLGQHLWNPPTGIGPDDPIVMKSGQGISKDFG